MNHGCFHRSNHISNLFYLFTYHLYVFNTRVILWRIRKRFLIHWMTERTDNSFPLIAKPNNTSSRSPYKRRRVFKSVKISRFCNSSSTTSNLAFNTFYLLKFNNNHTGLVDGANRKDRSNRFPTTVWVWFRIEKIDCLDDWVFVSNRISNCLIVV